MHFDLWLPPFELEAGPRLPHLYLRGWWWGPPSERHELSTKAIAAAPTRETVLVRDELAQRTLAEAAERTEPAPLSDALPTIVVVHALTADATAGGDGGWWSPLVGPGRPLDPTKARLLCFNNLGSCYGSYGPADAGFPEVRAELGVESTLDLEPGARTAKGQFELPARAPATITTWDQARALWLALDRLGIERVELITGGSLGGMIALAAAMLAPDRVGTVAPIAAAVRATPWVQGWNHAARSAILMDPGFPLAAERGLEVARQIAHMTYRAEPGLELRQTSSDGSASQTHLLPMQTYLEHQGRKLRARFDARAYLAQTTAMDRHDLLRPPPGPEPAERWVTSADWSLARLTSRIRAIGIDSDQLFFPRHLVELVDEQTRAGRDAAYREIASPHGHDAFLIEWDQMQDALRWALTATS